MFPKMSKAMMKEGPQIKLLFEDQDFSTILNSIERRASAFEKVYQNFLRNEKADTVKYWGVTCH